MNRLFRLAPVFALMPLTANAKDADPAIVVTGQGLPPAPASPAYSVQDIGREAIGNSASGRLEDVLSAVAGFQQFRRSDSRSANPSAQGVTLRGLGGNASSRTLVLLDGVPMADPFFGYIPFSAIAPERLSAVRVTRGGGAGAFGAGAVAGTVELSSAGADELGLWSGEALVNDRGESALSATLAPRLGQGFAVVSGRWDRGQGFWTTPPAQRAPASVRARYDSWSAGLRMVAPLASGVELQARMLAFDDRRTLRFDGADSRSAGQDASLRLIGTGAWQFDVLGYVQARDFSNVVISATTYRRTLDQRHTPSTGLGGKAELRPPVGGGHVLRLGADWRRSTGGLQEDVYAPTGQVTGRRRAGGRNDDLGFYVENDWTAGPLVLTGGVRADRWRIADGYFTGPDCANEVVDRRFADRAGWDTSFRGGAVLQAGSGIALRGSGYAGLRQPTLNELYRFFTVFPVVTCANADLANEELAGFEGGFDLTPAPGVRLSLTGFDNSVRHAIANVSTARNRRERRNVDAVHARGVEASAQVRRGRFALDGAVSFTDAEVEASGSSAGLDGKRPAQVPRWTASATLAWKPRDEWRLAASVRHIGAQYEDDLEADLIPPATTLDLVAQVPLGKAATLVLRAENVTDARVVTRQQGLSTDLGAPRTVWAGVRVRLGS